MSLASGQTVGPAGHWLCPQDVPSRTKKRHGPQSVQVVWEMGHSRKLGLQPSNASYVLHFEVFVILLSNRRSRQINFWSLTLGWLFCSNKAPLKKKIY